MDIENKLNKNQNHEDRKLVESEIVSIMGKELTNEQKIKLLRLKGLLYRRMHRYSEGIKSLNQALDIIDTHNVKLHKEKGDILYLRGWLYYWLGEWDDAIKSFQDSIELIKEYQNEVSPYLLNIMGFTYMHKGELNLAQEQYERSKIMLQETPNDLINSITTSNLGRNYSLKGDIGLAEDYLIQTLQIIKEKKVKHPWAFANIGSIYFHKGDYELALSYTNKALKIFEEQDDIVSMAWICVTCVEICLMKEDRVKCEFYLSELEKLVEKAEKFPELDRLYTNLDYSKGLYLKSSHRMRDQVKAEELFESISNLDRTIWHLTVPALKHLADLKMNELKLYGHPEVLDEINGIIDELHNMAQEQGLFSLLVEILIMKSKLSGIQGNFDETTTFLKQAIAISQSKGLNSLLHQAQNESDIVLRDFEKMKKFVEENPSWSDRIEELRLLEYMKTALSIAK